MPPEVISYMMASQNRKQRMQFEIIIQCAPFLKGIKTASIMNIDKRWIRELYEMIEDTDISCHILVTRKDRCLVLFYREKELTRVLADRDVWEFLKEYGYEDDSLAMILTRLSMRMNLYSKGEIRFPHEIGVFLDYPLEDVKAFIEKGGRDYLFSGYWKVYHNPEWAQLTFLAYDKAKDSAVNEFLIGKSIREIAKKSA